MEDLADVDTDLADVDTDLADAFAAMMDDEDPACVAKEEDVAALVEACKGGSYVVLESDEDQGSDDDIGVQVKTSYDERQIGLDERIRIAAEGSGSEMKRRLELGSANMLPKFQDSLPHQGNGIMFMLMHLLGNTAYKGPGILNGCLIGDEMGMGKTFMTIRVILSCCVEKAPVLVVCPPTLVNQWKAEYVKFVGADRARDVEVINTTQMSNCLMQATFTGIRIVLTSYDFLARYTAPGVHGLERDEQDSSDGDADDDEDDEEARPKNKKKRPNAKNKKPRGKKSKKSQPDVSAALASLPLWLRRHEWPLVVLDEVHSIKEASTNSHQRVRALCVTLAKAVIGLSATPIQNHEKEVIAYAALMGIDIDETGVDAFLTDKLLKRQNTMQTIPPLKSRTIVLEPDERDREVHAMIDAFQTSDMNKTMLYRQACVLPALCIRSMSTSKVLRKKPLLLDRENPPPKIAALVKALQEINARNQARKQGEDMERAIVFFTWHDEADAIAKYMVWGNLSTPLRYDGKVNGETKNTLVHFFNHREVMVMLLQVNCGANGLNLQGANHVFIMTPNYNPCIELQGVGRAHRIGQKREVHVTRFALRTYADLRCLSLQKAKVRLVQRSVQDTTITHKLKLPSLLHKYDLKRKGKELLGIGDKDISLAL